MSKQLDLEIHAEEIPQNFIKLNKIIEDKKINSIEIIRNLKFRSKILKYGEIYKSSYNGKEILAIIKNKFLTKELQLILKNSFQIYLLLIII